MESGSDKVRRLVQESIADEDFAAAQKMQPQMEALIDQIDAVFGQIENQMSSFNAPGMRSALAGAIKNGLVRQGFRAGTAKAELSKYFRARR